MVKEWHRQIKAVSREYFSTMSCPDDNFLNAYPTPEIDSIARKNLDNACQYCLFKIGIRVEAMFYA